MSLNKKTSRWWIPDKEKKKPLSHTYVYFDAFKKYEKKRSAFVWSSLWLTLLQLVLIKLCLKKSKALHIIPFYVYSYLAFLSCKDHGPRRACNSTPVFDAAQPDWGTWIQSSAGLSSPASHDRFPDGIPGYESSRRFQLETHGSNRVPRQCPEGFGQSRQASCAETEKKMPFLNTFHLKWFNSCFKRFFVIIENSLIHNAGKTAIAPVGTKITPETWGNGSLHSCHFFIIIQIYYLVREVVS